MTRGEPAAAPAHTHLLRLPFFRGFRRGQLEGLLDRASIVEVAPGALLAAEDQPSPAMYLTLIGGRAAAAAASARERSVVLVLAAEEVSRGLDDDPFASAIERAVVAALRTAERPQARPASRIDADALS